MIMVDGRVRQKFSMGHQKASQSPMMVSPDNSAVITGLKSTEKILLEVCKQVTTLL
jgi:hypothetical protein